ncbi:hypothetical protein HaLaN_27735 [Haematococcus lacustris]|uniref:Uncharacterized protein n=1 Tax=Haematococcus lacustris TaxID=44745 RepID=A0A6A0AB58_HAELA|nr:hypothetical protein HaLaN_27735 [Haematococcus lacustris]
MTTCNAYGLICTLHSSPPYSARRHDSMISIRGEHHAFAGDRTWVGAHLHTKGYPLHYGKGIRSETNRLTPGHTWLSSPRLASLKPRCKRAGGAWSASKTLIDVSLGVARGPQEHAGRDRDPEAGWGRRKGAGAYLAPAGVRRWPVAGGETRVAARRAAVRQETHSYEMADAAKTISLSAVLSACPKFDI